MERYDIAIIGSGPAGVSAAITAKLRQKNIIFFGNKSMGKVSTAHEIQNYPGLPRIKGTDLAEALSNHLDDMAITLTEEKVSTLYNMGKYFSMQSSAGTIYEASTVILATGVIAAKTLPGESELLGRGVSYCATCDAPLYKGREVIIVGYNPAEEAEARYMADIASKVIYIPVYKEDVDLPSTVEVIKEKPLAIEEKDGKRVLKTDNSFYQGDGIFILRESIAPSQLIPGLETDGAHVVVDREMKTNINGCFACGDIVGKPYQYIKAAGEGNIAALSAVSYLQNI